MAKKAALSINYSLNSVALEDDMISAELAISQEAIDVAAFSDVGPRKVVGNYDYSSKIAGHVDFATGQSDATLHAMVGSAGVAMAFDPTGVTADADNPNYDSTTVILTGYSIKGAIGGAVDFDAEVVGAVALARAVE